MGERPTYPTDRDVIDARFEQHGLETFTALPGRVQSYDAATQTADVVPLVRHPVSQPDGGHAFEELPVIPSVPILWPRVGEWFLAFALAEGDSVQLLFNSADIGPWRVGDGGVTSPGDLRRHHLSHAVAIPGLYPRGRALANAPSGSAALRLGSDDANGPTVTLHTNGDTEVVTGGVQVTLRANGTAEITQGGVVVARIDPTGTVSLGGVVGDFVALSSLVTANFAALLAAFTGHTHVVTNATPVTPGPVAAAPPMPPLPALPPVGASKVKAL